MMGILIVFAFATMTHQALAAQITLSDEEYDVRNYDKFGTPGSLRSKVRIRLTSSDKAVTKNAITLILELETPNYERYKKSESMYIKSAFLRMRYSDNDVTVSSLPRQYGYTVLRNRGKHLLKDTSQEWKHGVEVVEKVFSTAMDLCFWSKLDELGTVTKGLMSISQDLSKETNDPETLLALQNQYDFLTIRPYYVYKGADTRFTKRTFEIPLRVTGNHWEVALLIEGLVLSPIGANTSVNLSLGAGKGHGILLRVTPESLSFSEGKKEQGLISGKTMTNSIGMKLVCIPPGEFMMGSRDPASEVVRKYIHGRIRITELQGEHPRHPVRISKGFWMGIYEVTQDQYQMIMKSNPSHFKGDTLPVEQVSWEDAVEFCNRLSQADGKDLVYSKRSNTYEINYQANGYRLPTEAEWEYACRAGTTTPFYTGETISTDQANYDGDYVYDSGRNGIDRSQTVPVGSFTLNAFGLYDMHGNVNEWCADWVEEVPYKSILSIDPLGPSSGKLRALRGGSWGAHPGDCRSALRHAIKPGWIRKYVGFRVVCLAHISHQELENEI